MPKTEIDYSNTIIYKITCKDAEIKDVYVGHTTNFVQRKHSHKQGCINPKSSNYDCKLYNTIREKGGWSNWKMEIINFFNCYDHYEARQKEQEYFVSLNATLNSIEPMPKPKEKPIPIIKPIKKDSNCIIDTVEPDLQDNIQKPKKTPMVFMCESCDYNTSNKKDYTKHILTSKHQNAIKGYTEATTQNPCICGKKFRHSSSLYRHKKFCVLPDDKAIEEPDHTIVSDQSLITFLIKQNQEFKDMIMEQNKTIVDAIKQCSSSISNSTVN